VQPAVCYADCSSNFLLKSERAQEHDKREEEGETSLQILYFKSELKPLKLTRIRFSPLKKLPTRFFNIFEDLERESQQTVFFLSASRAL
jgi:hypothetical protein